MKRVGIWVAISMLAAQAAWAAPRPSDPAEARYRLAAKLRTHGKLTRAEREALLPERPALSAKSSLLVHEFVGSEFYRGTVATYRRSGFEIQKLSGKRSVAKRGKLRVVLHNSEEHVLRSMDDPKVDAIFYSGHSDVGGTVALNLAEPGVRAQRGNKLLAMFQCIGTQTLPQLAARFPRAHLVATRGVSYDDQDGVARNAILDGLERGESYAEMRKNIRSRGGAAGNYLFPDMRELTKHYDLDRDGRLDVMEAGTRDRGFRKKARDGRAAAPGLALASGARFLHSTHGFYLEEVKDAVLTHQEAKTEIAPAGLHQGDGKMVTRARFVERAGKPTMLVSLDEKFARAPQLFISAATVFESSLAMHEKYVGPVDRKAKLRAYAFAVDYLQRHSPWDPDPILKRLAKMKDVPALPAFPVYKLETPHFLGSDKMIAGMERMAKRGQLIP